jgi:hypothetical protein
MDLRKIVDWMRLVQDMDQWIAFVNMAMKLRVPYRVGTFLTS